MDLGIIGAGSGDARAFLGESQSVGRTDKRAKRGKRRRKRRGRKPKFNGSHPVHRYSNSGAKRASNSQQGKQVAPGLWVTDPPDCDCGGSKPNDFHDLVGEALEHAIVRCNRKGRKFKYKEARSLVLTVVDRYEDKLQTVYTGRSYSKRGQPSANGPNGINVEHVWPQSKLVNGSKGRGRSDMHHLFAADTDMNSVRSSYPFGEVVRVKYEEGGSKLGYDAKGRMVFEPRDESKGNIARAMFYVAVAYPMDIPAAQESILRAWHEQDPVDARERERHQDVVKLQANRNDFIDDPDLVRRIDDF